MSRTPRMKDCSNCPSTKRKYTKPYKRAGGQKKAPGTDGIGREFYSHNWGSIKDDLCEIVNQMFWAGTISQQQKRGVIVCLPKAQGNQPPEDYRPITLLNSDYKILARIIAQHLRPVLADHLTETQFCEFLGNTIMDAVATVRDTIAYAERRKIPLCVLSLDFKNAFDRISHNYLFQTPQGYGIGNKFIKRMYEGAMSLVQINGYQYGTIPIRCSVRQGCPMNMALYPLCLHPFLRLLDLKLPGIMIGRRTRPTSVVAYADDVTIFVTSVAEFAIIEEAIRIYERASGARLNPRKSKALAIGNWCTQETVLGIAYHPHVTILGVTFWGTIEQRMIDSWERLTGKVRVPAKRAYTRGPCLATRMRYVNTFLLSKIWYTAQILPAPKHIHTTIDNSHYLVHLERNSLSSVGINPTMTKAKGRMGNAGY